MDASESILPVDFEAQTEYTKRVAEAILSQAGARVAVGEFSTTAKFARDEFTSDFPTIETDLGDLEQSEELTNTAAALQAAAQFFEDSSGTDRQKVLLVTTDGPTTLEDQANLPDALAQLDTADVNRVIIGFENDLNVTELALIAGPSGMIIQNKSLLDPETLLSDECVEASVTAVQTFCTPSKCTSTICMFV